MDNSNITTKRFDEMVKRHSPNSKVVLNCLKAFVVGGLICVLGQLLSAWFMRMGMEKDAAGTLSSVSLIFLAVLFTGIGIYGNLVKFGGAGAAVPITGFANAVAAPAIEFKKEGYVLGVGAKMFIIAGPVIVYGLAASALVGAVYWVVNKLIVNS